jgi:hypothetical protein
MWADECAVLREGEEKDEEVGDDGGVLGGAPNDGDDDGSNDIQVVPIEINNDAQSRVHPLRPTLQNRSLASMLQEGSALLL